jgi:hypothetical protein
MKFKQIRHNDTTCYSKIQWEQLQVHVCNAVHPNCKLLAQAVQLNRRNPADHHSPCADWGLWTRGPDPIIAVPYLHFAQLQSKYKWERKTWKKHSFSDGKRFTDFVLLRCFIDFQTTLVDSRNLVIFLRFGKFLHAYLVIALQNIWSHWIATSWHRVFVAVLYFGKKAIFSTMFTVSECDLISNTLTSHDSAPIRGRPTLKDAERFRLSIIHESKRTFRYVKTCYKCYTKSCQKCYTKSCQKVTKILLKWRIIYIHRQIYKKQTLTHNQVAVLSTST